MSKLFSLSALLVVLLCAPIFGQITVSTNEFMPAPGTVLQFMEDQSADESYFNSLMTGSGGPMEWDFSSRTYAPAYEDISVTPATAPAIGDFPDGNLVMLSVDGTDSAWQVYNSVPSSFVRLGTVVHSQMQELVTVYEDLAPDFVFPMTYNSQWTAHRFWNQPNPGGYADIYDTTYNVVDAWGTAKYGSKTVPCLRIISTERTTYNAFDSSTGFLGSFVYDITNVNFVTDGFTTLVTATKVNSGLSTSYTAVASGDFLNTPTDVRESDEGELPTGFALSQNYPNPFNPSTDIKLSIPRESRVTLTVYDILGREVRTLIDRSLAAGSYVVDWDGRNQAGEQVASGVYLYRLSAGQFTQTRKMTLLK